MKRIFYTNGLRKWKEIQPDILIGYNSDHFDIPYLYYRTCNILGKEFADENVTY